MSRVKPQILADLILKNKIIEDFEKKFNINKKFIDKHYDLFLEYANTQIELLKYAYSVPLEKLKIFNELNFKQTQFFIKLNNLLDEEIIDF